MIKINIIALTLTSLLTLNMNHSLAHEDSYLFSLGLGGEGQIIDSNIGDNSNAYGLAAVVELGKRWTRWEMGLVGFFSGGPAERFSATIQDKQFTGDYWHQSSNIGPYFKYYFSSHDGWQFYSTLAPLFSYKHFSAKDNVTTDLGEDYGKSVEAELLGYGAMMGLGFSFHYSEGIIQQINYQLTYRWSDYKKLNAEWMHNDSSFEHSENIGGNFRDQSIALTVGLTFSDNFFNKSKELLSKASEKILNF